MTVTVTVTVTVTMTVTVTVHQQRTIDCHSHPAQHKSWSPSEHEIAIIVWIIGRIKFDTVCTHSGGY